MKVIDELAFSGKKVLLRADLNIPLTQDGTITDDFRLRVILPTLNYLLNNNAKVILMGHLGRPKGIVDSKLSLRPVFLRLSALLNRSIIFAPNLFSPATKKAVSDLRDGQILGLENLRFDKGEESNLRTFARRLAEYGDVYINDAFSVSHREAASIVAVTEFLPSYAGLLMEKECSMLGSLLQHPAHPFITIVGGVKIAEKLPLLKHLIHQADRVLVGGGVANNFLAIQGIDVKTSVVDQGSFEAAKIILKEAKGKLVVPSDYTWKKDVIADIGLNTVKQFQAYLKGAKTIFWNGCLGITEEAEFTLGSNAIAKAMAESGATTIVGGGNTIEVLTRLKLTDKITFVSSGGGSTLEFLSGKTLPGVTALNSA